MAGEDVAEVIPVPANIAALTAFLEGKTRCHKACLKLLRTGGDAEILGDDESLNPEGEDLLLVVDEAPLATWAVSSNRARDMLLAEDGCHIKFVAGTTERERLFTCRLRFDVHITVLTEEPLRQGVHFFKFVMHHIGGEQWCGLLRDCSQAGNSVEAPSLDAWAYYTGRPGGRSRRWAVGNPGNPLAAGAEAALHAARKSVAPFQALEPSGDVIGMLVDMDAGAVAFDLNGELPGACPIPPGVPLWVFTHLTSQGDHVELRKPPVHEANEETNAALGGELLDVSEGLDINDRRDYSCPV